MLGTQKRKGLDSKPWEGFWPPCMMVWPQLHLTLSLRKLRTNRLETWAKKNRPCPVDWWEEKEKKKKTLEERLSCKRGLGLFLVCVPWKMFWGHGMIKKKGEKLGTLSKRCLQARKVFFHMSRLIRYSWKIFFISACFHLMQKHKFVPVAVPNLPCKHTFCSFFAFGHGGS